MTDLSTLALPVLPLRNGIVFPNMVVTVSIESAGGRLLLVPRIEDDFASVGTIAEIQEVQHGDVTAVLIAGVQRATIGIGQPGSSEGAVGRSAPGRRVHPHDAF